MRAEVQAGEITRDRMKFRKVVVPGRMWHCTLHILKPAVQLEKF